MQEVSVSISIVNYYSALLIHKAVESIIEHSGENVSLEIIIVNNSPSPDESNLLVELANNSTCDIKVLEMASNVGFSRANNEAFKAARGEFFLIYNPDLYLIEDTITKGLNVLNENAEASALTVTFLYPDKSYQKSAFDSNQGFKMMIYNLDYVGKIISLIKKVIKKVIKKEDNRSLENLDDLIEVEVICGGFIMTRKKIYQEIGGFDEDFFLYGEDWEISHRLRSVGKVFLLKSSSVIHDHGGTSEKEFGESGISLDLWSRKGIQTFVSLSLWQVKEFGKLRLIAIVILTFVEFLIFMLVNIFSVIDENRRQVVKSVWKYYAVLLKNHIRMLMGHRVVYRTM